MRYILHRAMLACAATIVALLFVLIAPAARAEWEMVDDGGRPLTPNDQGWYNMSAIATATARHTYSDTFIAFARESYDGRAKMAFNPQFDYDGTDTSAQTQMYWYGATGYGLSYLGGATQNFYIDDSGRFIYEGTFHDTPFAVAGGVTIDGRIEGTAFLRWTGPLPIPSFVNLIVRVEDRAEADATSSGPANSNATLTDSFGITVSRMGGEYPYWIDQTRTHIVRVVPGTLDAVYTMSATGHMHAESGSAYYPLVASAGVRCGGAYKVARAYITSPTIETSFYEAGGSRVVHERNGDDSLSTDSVVSWQHRDLGGPADWAWRAYASYSPFQSAFDIPSYDWHFSQGDVRHDSPYRWDVTYDFGASPDQFPTGTNASMVVTEQNDPESPSLANAFSTQWHLPYELRDQFLFGDLGLAVPSDNPVTGAIDPGVQNPVDIHIAPRDIPFEITFDAGAAIAAIIVAPELEGVFQIARLIAGVSQFYLSVPQVDARVTNDATNWQVALNYQSDYPGHVPPELINDPDGWQHCTMEEDEVTYTRTDAWHTNEYDGHGFTGIGTMQLRHTTLVRLEPFFTAMPGF